MQRTRRPIIGEMEGETNLEAVMRMLQELKVEQEKDKLWVNLLSFPCAMPFVIMIRIVHCLVC